MPNPSCPECGPQGGHGRVMLAFDAVPCSVPCSLCDGTSPAPDGSMLPEGVARVRPYKQSELSEPHERARLIADAVQLAASEYPPPAQVCWWDADGVVRRGSLASFQAYCIALSTAELREAATPCAS